MRLVEVSRALLLIAGLAAPQLGKADAQPAREAPGVERRCQDSDDGWSDKYGADQSGQGSQAAEHDTGWPRQIVTDDYTVDLY
jgi:hypothetical protein